MMKRLVSVFLVMALMLGVLVPVANASKKNSCTCDYEKSPGGVWVPKGTTSKSSSSSGGGAAGATGVGGVAKKAIDAVDNVAKWIGRTKIAKETAAIAGSVASTVSSWAKNLKLPKAKNPNLYKGWGGH